MTSAAAQPPAPLHVWIYQFKVMAANKRIGSSGIHISCSHLWGNCSFLESKFFKRQFQSNSLDYIELAFHLFLSPVDCIGTWFIQNQTKKPPKPKPTNLNLKQHGFTMLSEKEVTEILQWVNLQAGVPESAQELGCLLPLRCKVV